MPERERVDPTREPGPGRARASQPAPRLVLRVPAAAASGPEGGALDDHTSRRISDGSAGRPLPDDVLRRMESAFGADFGDVRVTTDSPLAPQIGARAFTYGSKIHFAAGEFQPSTAEGQRVLAHELAHTVQQGAAPTRINRSRAGEQSGPDPSPASRIRRHREPMVQGLFTTMRANLVRASGARTTNAAFTRILGLLSQGITLQHQTPSVENVPPLLGLLGQIDAEIPNATSTKTGSKKKRNAALTALGTAVGAERTQLTDMLTRLRATRRNRGQALNAGRFAGPGGNVASTGTANASGSYFDRNPANNAVLGIFKPESQEGGAKSGTATRGAGAVREVAGYEASRRLGLGVVPQTELVAIESAAFAGGAHGRITSSGEAMQVGSYQQGVQNVGGDVTKYLTNNATAPRAFDADSLQKMAILDALTLNADRHGENVMYRNDGTIAAIDQGEIAPDAKRFVDKFDGQTVQSGWAWADLPEAEQAWSAANRQLILDMDVEAEVNAIATTVHDESDRMATFTGGNAADTYLSDQQVALMKYSGRLLKITARGNLSPAETETIYKGRGTDSRAATAKKTAKAAGGGEFADFVKSTFLKDQTDAMVAKATGQPPPEPKYHYGDATCEEQFLASAVSGLTRVYTSRPHPPADVPRAIREATGMTALPRVLALIDTADPATIPATVPGPENAARGLVRRYLAHKAAGEWDEAYKLLVQVRQFSTALEASEPLANTHRLAAEMVEVSAHLNLPDPDIGAALPPVTVNSTSAEAGRLWAHVDPPVAALTALHVDDKQALAALWDGGPAALRQRMIDILDSGPNRLKMSHTGYVMEAIDPQHRMTVTSKLGEWFVAGHHGQFLQWLVNHPPDDTTNATYDDDNARAAARVHFSGGKLLQGVPAPTPLATGGGEGWIVVLSTDGSFYTREKSPRAQANDKTQHSSFLGGTPVLAAAMWTIEAGVLKSINNYSGHYKPNLKHMVRFLMTLEGNGVNVSRIHLRDQNGLGPLEGKLEFTGDEYLAAARRHLRG